MSGIGAVQSNSGSYSYCRKGEEEDQEDGESELGNLKSKELGLIIFCLICLLFSRQNYGEYEFDSRGLLPAQQMASEKPLIEVFDLYHNSSKIIFVASDRSTLSGYFFKDDALLSLAFDFTSLFGETERIVSYRFGLGNSQTSSDDKLHKEPFFPLLAIVTSDCNLFVLKFSGAEKLVKNESEDKKMPFNSNFALLWKASLLESDGKRICFSKSASLLISPVRSKTFPRGYVLVGSRLKVVEGLVGVMMDDLAFDDEDEMTHFSYLAFAADTGKIVWHHLGDDFQPPDRPEDEFTIAVHHHDLHSKKSLHKGEHSWRLYSNSFFSDSKILPHRWSTDHDDILLPTRFERNRIVNENSHLGKAHYKAVMKDLLNPANKFNSITSSIKEGLEVLDMYTGRPICHLNIPFEIKGIGNYGHAHRREPQSVLDDINGDGTLDLIALREREVDANACILEVSNGVPPIDKMFEIDVCEIAESDFNELFYGIDGSHASLLNEVTGTLPFDIKFDDRKIFALPPLVATFLENNMIVRRLFVFLSTGKVHCLSTDGEVLWSASTHAKWGHLEANSDFVSIDELERMAEIDSMLVPTLASHELYETDRHSSVGHTQLSNGVIVVVGTTVMSILSAKDGSFLAEFFLSSTPMGHPVFDDVNGDGVSDIIMPGNEKVELFIGSYHGMSYFGFFVSLLLSVFVVLFVSKLLIMHKDEY
eukprot:Nk52_evm3s218 gene=Nk52_evmTU3s218